MKLIQLLLLLFLTASANAQSFKTKITLQTPESGQSRYKYIPFDVPENTQTLSFRYKYDKKGGDNRLEFGVFETGFSGRDGDKRGLRGWSGSVRDSAFIAEDRATHGYSAGKIQPGKWYFIIGLAQVATEGVELELRVNFNQIDEKPLKQFQAEQGKRFSFDKHRKRKKLRSNGLTWFRGDLHAHSFHGDGSWSVKAILDSAKSNSLDFVALTEHNTFTHYREIDDQAAHYPDLLILRGQEVTTYGGHINVWGLPRGEWVDFRVLPDLESSGKRIAKEARSFGALASINHPTMNCRGCKWTYDDHWGNLDSVEIWNATWDRDDEEALKTWDKFLKEGRSITAIGSSDSHQPPYEPSTYPTNLAIGNPTVFVGAKQLDQEDLFKGIRSGSVFVTKKPQYTIELSANRIYNIGDKIETSNLTKIKLSALLKGFPAGSKMVLISDGAVVQEELTPKGKLARDYEFRPVGRKYIRLEVRDAEGKMLGFTNPIYLSGKTSKRKSNL
ncbi:MAG: PHP domain-containing protein [Pyrinomonadaceae bacterium]|nr:PHP domain-containing protein [Pyrinomonadaceae bacterium]